MVSDQGQNRVDDKSLRGLMHIFNIESKTELEKHVRNITVDDTDFANLVLASMTGQIEIEHRAQFKHYEPPDLELNKDNLDAFSTAKMGENLNPQLKKTFNKISEMMNQRRLLNCHLFWFRDAPEYWFLFYFDQRDTDQYSPNWKYGPHIHLICHLTHPHWDGENLLTIMDDDRPKIGGSIHIRYKRSRS